MIFCFFEVFPSLEKLDQMAADIQAADKQAIKQNKIIYDLKKAADKKAMDKKAMDSKEEESSWFGCCGGDRTEDDGNNTTNEIDTFTWS